MCSVDLGAAGFIPKRYSSEMMIAALGKVLAGQIFLSAKVLRLSAADQGPRSRGHVEGVLQRLTGRQRDVYRAAARGLSNKLIARDLDIAESTVKTHLTAVYAELGVRNRTEAAYQAPRDGVDTAVASADEALIEREARIAERTDVLCLRQMMEMGRRSYILLPSVFFIAYLAVR